MQIDHWGGSAPLWRGKGARARHLALLFAGVSALGAPAALAGAPLDSQLVVFSDASGLSGEALFTLLDSTTFEVRVRNTSTGVPSGFSNSDQLLTGVSWDFGLAGHTNPGDTTITGGSVQTGDSSFTVDFDQISTQLGPNSDISGEWAYGNMDGTGALANFVSVNIAQGTPFGGPNLDGPTNVDGPQGGLIPSTGPIIPLGGLGAVQNEVIATLTLSDPVSDLGFLIDNDVRFEFGSDAIFFTVDVIPAPATLGLLTGVGLFGRRRRR